MLPHLFFLSLTCKEFVWAVERGILKELLRFFSFLNQLFCVPFLNLFFDNFTHMYNLFWSYSYILFPSFIPHGPFLLSMPYLILMSFFLGGGDFPSHWESVSLWFQLLITVGRELSAGRILVLSFLWSITEFSVCKCLSFHTCPKDEDQAALRQPNRWIRWLSYYWLVIINIWQPILEQGVWGWNFRQAVQEGCKQRQETKGAEVRHKRSREVKS